MKFTNEKALEYIKAADSCELYADIETYSEAERHDRTDLQILADECGWLVSKFEDVNYSIGEELLEAKEFLRETRNGKAFSVSEFGHICPASVARQERRVADAKATVEEYKRLKRLLVKLNKLGFVSKWY